MTTFMDILAGFDRTVAERYPALSVDDRVRYAAALVNELSTAIGQGGTPAAVLPCGRMVRLGVEDMTAPVGIGVR
jgi:hypothetical protein